MGEKVKEFLAYLESHVGDAYVWGAQGERVDNRADLEKWVRRKETSRREADRALAYIKKATKTPLYAFDCSGLITHWLRDIKGLIDGDTNAQGLYKQCEQRGKLGAWRMEPGGLVFRYSAAKAKMGHVGVYIGDGMVIEAKGRDYGVVNLHLSFGGWTHQGKHPALAEDTAPTVFRLTSPMMRGENVKLMQAALTACGYDCGKADGICGKATMAAVKAFATAHTEV
jgi:cell wall-associated NlpC family hydrolase